MTPTRTFPYEDIALAYGVSGGGPPLILLHGWPFHRASFRKLLPYLEPHFTCYALDAAGMGESGWSARTRFDFDAHADRVRAFADHLGLGRYRILAHDTGATIARVHAAANADRVERMALLATECPGHRPPFIPLFQRVLGTRLGREAMKLSMRSEVVLRSSLGFGGCFKDKARIDAEFRSLFVEPWMKSEARLLGLAKYVRGIDFGVVDDLDAVHARLKAPMTFIWGAEDPVFPADIGEAAAKRAPTCRGFARIEGARFLAHEERPREVAEHAVAFLRRGD